MTADATSPLRIVDTRGAWRRFFAFVQRPELPDRAEGFSAEALGVVAKLYALDLLVMLALMAALALVQKLGLHLPGSVLEHAKLSPLLLGFITVGAPIGEELVFRSWQSGRPGHLGAALIGIPAAGVGLGLMVPASAVVAHVWEALAILVVGLALAGWCLWYWRGRPAMAWFQRHFVWFYFGATLLFAAAHLTNFIGGGSLAMLPLVLPQFIVGLMLGYVRVRFGLWADVLLHIAHNSLFMVLLLSGAS